jgi:alpha-beta hydrolase superfamily lysophospholipase
MKRSRSAAGAFVMKLAWLVLALVVAIFIGFGLLDLGFRLLLHAAHESLQSHPNPAPDYEAAANRFGAIQKMEGPELDPVCHSILLTHGVRTEKAIVFFHGYTNCPQQFRELGQIFFDMGDNVLIPRLPRHGMADRKVENLSPLKAEELRDCADASLDIARGLGHEIYVVGLSAGGTLTAWIAQNRSEVARVVLIAPALGLTRREGTRLQKAMALFLPLLPDIRTDSFNIDPDAPSHTYPGFSSRALAQLLRLSAATFAGALDQPPRVQDVVLITSKSDEAVSDYVAWGLIGLWRAKGLSKFTAVDFPKAMNIDHDMIDPSQRYAQTQIVYPLLISLLNAP